MTFYGKTAESNEAEPMVTYTYKDWGGREHTVQAHFVQFQPEHVTFWENVEGGNTRLRLAKANKDVHDLKEVASA